MFGNDYECNGDYLVVRDKPNGNDSRNLYKVLSWGNGTSNAIRLLKVGEISRTYFQGKDATPMIPGEEREDKQWHFEYARGAFPVTMEITSYDDPKCYKHFIHCRPGASLREALAEIARTYNEILLQRDPNVYEDGDTLPDEEI